MSRMVGGTFGVAAMGALISALWPSRKIDDLLPAVPAERRAAARRLASAPAARRSAASVGDAVQRRLRLRAQRRPARSARAVAVVGAVLAWLLIADRAEAPAAAEAGAEERADAAAPPGEPVAEGRLSVRRRGYGRGAGCRFSTLRPRRDPRAARARRVLLARSRLYGAHDDALVALIATIFLPLTVATGFFGMNFGWMVAHIDSRGAFLVLGVGGMIVPALVAVILFLRTDLLGRRDG